MKVKYPRTHHMPFSPGATNDDKILKTLDQFIGKDVVITEKLDGENTTLYCDGFHARSIDSRHHPARDWLARFHSQFAYDIPDGYRICGENLYAKHSIAYNNLPSYFMGFSVWLPNNTAMSWKDTLEFFSLLGIEPVPTLYQGTYSEKSLRDIVSGLDLNTQEGVVMRVADSFHYDDFGQSVAKWVRPRHVQTDDHWMHRSIVVNGLKPVT